MSNVQTVDIYSAPQADLTSVIPDNTPDNTTHSLLSFKGRLGVMAYMARLLA